MRTRHTFTATLLVALLAVAGVTAAIAADPPPPRIVFVANGHVPADALAAGPTAGQLGAPIFTTDQGSLPDVTADALDAYNPELVIVLGGTVAISDAVVTQISNVTGLAVVDPSPPPATGVVRAAGADRFATAAAIGDLLGDYNPAALPVDAKAVDSDLLDGMDSTEFLGATAKAADSELLDGMDASAFQPSMLWAMVDSDGTIVSQSGGMSMTASNALGGFYLDVGQDVEGRAIMVSQRYANTGGESNNDGEISAGVCGTDTVVCAVAGTNNPEHVFVFTSDSSGSGDPRPFYITIAP